MPSPSQVDIDALLASLGPAHVYLPGSEAYNKATTNYFVNANDHLQPFLVVAPTEAAHVSEAVRLARRAVRSSGMSCNPGFSACKDGVLIAFEPNMSNIRYSPGHPTTVLQPGARWGDVYHWFERRGHGVQVAGARVNDVGVGGFLLGGGLSYLSSMHGLGCDNVERFQVVLSNGEVVNATGDNEYKDLFLALKGGGGLPLAIVTEFEVRVHPIGPIWCGALMFPESSRDAMLEACSEFVLKSEDDKTNIIFNLVQIGDHMLYPVQRTYLAESPPPGPFDSIANVEATVNDGKTRSFAEANDQNRYPDGTLYNTNAQWFAGTVKPTPAVLKKIATCFDQLREELKGKTNLLVCSMEPFSRRMADVGIERGGNAFGVVDAPFIWFILQAQTKSADDHLLAQQACTRFVTAVNELARSEAPGKLPSGHVENFPMSIKDVHPSAVEEQAKGERPDGLPLFTNNANAGQLVARSSTAFPLLKAIRKKYDPDGFLSSQAQGFKL